MSMRLVVVGGGKMGGALVSGVLRAKWAKAAQVCVVEPFEDRRLCLLLGRFQGFGELGFLEWQGAPLAT